ncbi:type II toxin-antitoxin system Phd/YefM family antitoxin [Cryobacterium fucosi]|uniref:Antitoxin n=1 Tax=Cryobacterium fucosi TaxID=1259157 RepID=A0A4R9B7I3_9MICO|nr:type II toxin-antitoxin system prevent-host-death family antitoxin [Cryobacterium fucosi]TFD76058.1 type II toxin-antitoxin system prevent-host-death family antitoxin [Cryobacterium fucosi]
MEVPISALRAELSSWIERVRGGDEVVVTDRGVPVARLSQINTAPLLEQLVERGVLSRPSGSRRPAARDIVRAQASGSVSDFVTEQRR